VDGQGAHHEARQAGPRSVAGSQGINPQSRSHRTRHQRRHRPWRGYHQRSADHPGCRRIGSSKRALHMSRRHKNNGRILACHPSHRSGRLHFGLYFFLEFFLGPREVGGTSLFEVEFGRTQLETAWTESRVEPASTCQQSSPISPVGDAIGFTHGFGGPSAWSLQRAIVTVPKIIIIRTVMAGNREIAQ